MPPRASISGLRSATGVEDRHGETDGPPRDGRRDPTRPDDPEGLAGDVAAEHVERSPAGEPAGAHLGVPLGHAAGDAQDQGPGQVGRTVGEDAGRVGDEDAPLGRGGHVDVVIADGHVGEDAAALGGVEHVGVDRVGEQAEHGVGPGDDPSEFLGGERPVLAVGDDLLGRPRPPGSARARGSLG